MNEEARSGDIIRKHYYGCHNFFLSANAQDLKDLFLSHSLAFASASAFFQSLRLHLFSITIHTDNMIYLNDILGLQEDQLNFYQMAARAILTFFIAILYLRIAGLRTMGNHSGFDNLTTLIMGAIMGRGIVVANQPFFEALAILAIIMVLHRVLAWGTLHSKTLGMLIKGKPIILMKDSVWQENNLSHAALSTADVEESLRQEMRCHTFSKIKDIYLEHSGRISFVQKDDS